MEQYWQNANFRFGNVETRTLQPKRTPKSGCPTIFNVVFQSGTEVQSYRILCQATLINNATNHKQFCKKARMDPIFKKLNFGSLSIQTTPKHTCDFQF